jgi:DNA-binding protein HU-beta
MNKAELINEIAQQTGISKKGSENVLNVILNTITSQLANGEKVSLAGFGVFEPKERAPRVGRNPKTNEVVEIPATRSPKFKPAKAFKDLVV